jgi:lysozyme
MSNHSEKWDRKEGAEGSGISDPAKGLEAGRKAVPALRYAYALIGVAGTASTIIGYFKSPQFAVAAILLTLVGMILVWLFSNLTAKDAKHVDPAARVMVWTSVVFFVVGVCLLVTLAIFRAPANLADMLGIPANVQPPTEEDQKKIEAIFAAGAATATESNTTLYENRRVALVFIDGHTNDYCRKSNDQAMREKMQCPAQGAVATAALPPPSAIRLQRAEPPVAGPCSDTALAKAGSRTKILGVDVSSHDNNIDWQKLVADGYFFVFIKASQGTSYADVRFKEHWDAAGRAGLIRGAFHFLTSADPKGQVSNFLTALKKVVIGPCDIGAALDLEPTVLGGDAPSPASRIEGARSWLREVMVATGKPPILYVGTSYLSELGDPADFAVYPLWIASYSPSPNLPASRTHYSFWQFSDGVYGPRLGPSYRMDMNLFNGSAAELFALAQ